MSEDLIKRSDAIETAYQLRRKPNDDEWDWWLRSFNAIPPADRPQGEWLMVNRPLEGKFRIFRCSVCGYEPFYKGEPITPTNMTLLYCPNCGARMFAKDINAPNKPQTDCGWK